MNWQKRRYLSRSILGFDIGKKPPEKEKERFGLERDAKYRNWIRKTFPCCACGSWEHVEAAHTGTDGGMGQRASDYSCIPLCASCHRTGPHAYHAIGKQAFAELHGLDYETLVKRLNRAYGLVRRQSA